MSGVAERRLQCRLCQKTLGESEMYQVWPCLHMFCNPCVAKHRQKSEHCPARGCFCPLDTKDLLWNACSNEDCLNRLVKGRVDAHEISPCQHSICAYCYDDAVEEDPAFCPVFGCKSKLLDDQPAAKTKLELPKCKGRQDCANPALQNFPSEQECEHDMCLECVQKMVAKCEKSTFLPMCPNDGCRLPYRVETVSALKALMPERAAYFNQLKLDTIPWMEAIRDDNIMSIEFDPTYDVNANRLTLHGISSNDENIVADFEFTKIGTVGDLIRELVAVLSIHPTDKIYGIYIRREGTEFDDELVLNAETARKPVTAFGLDSECTLYLDMSGTVKSQSRT